MKTTLLESIDAISAVKWNGLATTKNPFLRHEFLVALERHGCVGSRLGWLPQHLIIENDAGELLGAVPMYLKYNSYGEFVFDWSWAEAYERHGRRYYPKLVVAVPYTPATGPRLLLADIPEKERVADALIEAAIDHAHAIGASSLHWLFTTEEDTRRLERHGLMRRTGCQFHWHNSGYADFDTYLGDFSAAKRKKIKRERRRVSESGIALRNIAGHEADTEVWTTVHDFYRRTFDDKGGVATLNQSFFEEIGRTMGEQILLIIASEGARDVAGAISFVGDDTLYGRHWGCLETFHSLHFETCYYRGLDFAMSQGLAAFEPGAQGEHKISRGFLPTATWSAHWIAEPMFRNAIADFLARETAAMEGYIRELSAHSPFRDNA